MISFCVERLNVCGSMLNMWSSLVRLTGEGVLTTESQHAISASDEEDCGRTFHQGRNQIEGSN